MDRERTEEDTGCENTIGLPLGTTQTATPRLDQDRTGVEWVEWSTEAAESRPGRIGKDSDEDKIFE